MLTSDEMKEIKDELLSSERPLIFFHDDADGLCSFLQFYKQVRRGRGITVKSTPKLDERFYNTVERFNPDKIFVLDLAVMLQEFVDKMGKPIIWLDHHELSKVTGVKYFNPRKERPDDNTCVAKMSYDIFKDNFWISAIGTIGDWQLPTDFRLKILKELPTLFDKGIKTPEKALFESKLGLLAKIFSFVLKGDTKEANTAVKILTRIDTPEEILEEKSPAARFLMKKYRHINEQYDELMAIAVKSVTDSRLLTFTYPSSKISLTGELSNELLYRYPNKVLAIARHHNGEMKISFRSGKGINVREIVERAMVGIDGRFGGHEQACGGSVKDTDWEKFVAQMREIVEKLQ